MTRFDHAGYQQFGRSMYDNSRVEPESWEEQFSEQAAEEAEKESMNSVPMVSAVIHEQGSPGWIEERLGYVTASCFAKAMTSARSKTEKFGKVAMSYLDDLLGEHLTQQPASEQKTFAMEWGNRWEPVAREFYRQKTNYEVREVGFYRHPTERFIGCSPDSLVNDDGVIEIKCPLTAANHVRVLISGEVPDEHTEQIQGVLWVTDRQWCDFVTYHDNFPPDLRMHVIRVDRDDKIISEISERIIEFRDEMMKRLETLANFWKRQAS